MASILEVLDNSIERLTNKTLKSLQGLATSETNKSGQRYNRRKELREFISDIEKREAESSPKNLWDKSQAPDYRFALRDLPDVELRIDPIVATSLGLCSKYYNTPRWGILLPTDWQCKHVVYVRRDVHPNAAGILLCEISVAVCYNGITIREWKDDTLVVSDMEDLDTVAPRIDHHLLVHINQALRYLDSRGLYKYVTDASRDCDVFLTDTSLNKDIILSDIILKGDNDVYFRWMLPPALRTPVLQLLKRDRPELTGKVLPPMALDNESLGDAVVVSRAVVVLRSFQLDSSENGYDVGFVGEGGSSFIERIGDENPAVGRPIARTMYDIAECISECIVDNSAQSKHHGTLVQRSKTMTQSDEKNSPDVGLKMPQDISGIITFDKLASARDIEPDCVYFDELPNTDVWIDSAVIRNVNGLYEELTKLGTLRKTMPAIVGRRYRIRLIRLVDFDRNVTFRIILSRNSVDLRCIDAYTISAAHVQKSSSIFDLVRIHILLWLKIALGYTQAEGRFTKCLSRSKDVDTFFTPRDRWGILATETSSGRRIPWALNFAPALCGMVADILEYNGVKVDWDPLYGSDDPRYVHQKIDLVHRKDSDASPTDFYETKVITAPASSVDIRPECLDSVSVYTRNSEPMAEHLHRVATMVANIIQASTNHVAAKRPEGNGDSAESFFVDAVKVMQPRDKTIPVESGEAEGELPKVLVRFCYQKLLWSEVAYELRWILRDRLSTMKTVVWDVCDFDQVRDISNYSIIFVVEAWNKRKKDPSKTKRCYQITALDGRGVKMHKSKFGRIQHREVVEHIQDTIHRMTTDMLSHTEA